DGNAQYRGDTMEGTVVSHLPRGDGGVIDITQQLTGRYLGSCTPLPDTRSAAATPAIRPPSQPAEGNIGGSLEPLSGPQGAAPAAPTSGEGAAATAEPPAPGKPRYKRRAYRRY